MSLLEKKMDKIREEDWEFAKKRNVDYNALVDFIKNNQKKRFNSNDK